MKLYGSLPSPYVRRVRLFMAEHDVEHTIELVSLYDDEARQAFAKISPVRKLPLLIDGDQMVMDSHVIHRYLCYKYNLPTLTVAQSNDLSVIDGALDSLIILFYCKQSGFEDDGERLIYKLQKERLLDTLTHLNKQVEAGCFDDWNYATMSLLSLVKWVQFRNLYNLDGFDALIRWTESQTQHKGVEETRPE